jgi:hypothetical protein
MTKPEKEFAELANKWLAANLGNEDVRTVVWNAISRMNTLITTENHDAMEVFLAETAQ